MKSNILSISSLQWSAPCVSSQGQSGKLTVRSKKVIFAKILKYESIVALRCDRQADTLKFIGSKGGGYFHIRRSECLAPNFVSEILVGARNFAPKSIGDKYPKFCPMFRYNPKCPRNCDSFPTFASCGNKTSQIFPLIW